MEKLVFTKQDWIDEVRASIGECHHSQTGSCTTPCPNCKNVGFYSWRDCGERLGNRMYRACKFCGFWQEADGEPYFCKMMYCFSCETHDWLKPDEEIRDSANCGKGTTYFVDWPVKDNTHEFWKYKKLVEKRHQYSIKLHRQAGKQVLIALVILFGSATLFVYFVVWLSQRV